MTEPSKSGIPEKNPFERHIAKIAGDLGIGKAQAEATAMLLGEGATVDLEALVAHGLARARGGRVKLLGEGTPPRNVTVRLHAASEGARRKLEEAGGRWEPLG